MSGWWRKMFTSKFAGLAKEAEALRANIETARAAEKASQHRLRTVLTSSNARSEQYRLSELGKSFNRDRK